MTESTPTRKCTTCSMVHPLTAEYFAPRTDPERPPGQFKSQCRGCRRDRMRWHNQNGARSERDYHRHPREVREPGPKPCGTCAGLAHRVEGIRCPECKLQRMSEPPPKLEDYMYRHYERVCV